MRAMAEAPAGAVGAFLPSLTPSQECPLLQLAKEYGMDFYETSACTNLNIKEVRTPRPSCRSLAEFSVGKPEEKVADSSHQMRPHPLGSYRAAGGRGGNIGLTRAPWFSPVFHASDGAGAAGPQEGAGWCPDACQQRVGIGRARGG